MLLVPRRFRVLIGTIDYTDCIMSYDGGDEKLGYSGLVVFRGKIVVGRALGFETLDDRKTKRWNRGTPVKVDITDDFQTIRPSPRGGSLFVLSSAYDFTERTLTIEVGDSFSLLSIREGSGDKTGICLGTSEDKTTVINRLLAAAGAPALIDSVPGTLSAPQPKLVTGSYIEQAGAIAAGSGYFLFVDSLNRVRSMPIEIGLGTPLLIVDIVSESSNYKRITGESPTAYFIVNSSSQTTDPSHYGFESTSESYGPIAIAGVPLFGEIIIRSEWQKESLSGNKRFVQTKVWEPIGAIIPLRKGQANKILSYDKLEIFEYESSSATSGTSASDKCQTGNQGRLKKRTLTVKRPLGTVLDKVIQTAPPESQPTALEDLILALRETEEFDYGTAQTFTIVSTIPPVPDAPAPSPNDIPPDDPATTKEKGVSGLRHTLSRFESAGAIAPEDFEWTSLFALWIASASTHTPSYELVKEWNEARSDEWIAIERERVSFNRANPEAAAENRDRIQSSPATANSYPRNLFCALQMTRNDRKVSSSGNTQPPAPDTIPSTFSLKTVPKTHKYKMPIDTDFPFRQKTQEINVEYLSIDGTLLAEKWGKIAWGRFKGLSIQSEFSQDWWDYVPMCRVNILEPSIGLTGTEINTSAYLGDSWAISMSDGECAIGMDGIFLGFIQNNVLIPPYVEVSFVEVVSTAVATIRSVTVINQTPIISQISLISTMTGLLASLLPSVRFGSISPLSNTIRDDVRTIASGDAILNTQTGFREAYRLTATWQGPYTDNSRLLPYQIEIRKNGGIYSLPISVPNTTGTLTFDVGTLTAEIPGIVFVSEDATPFAYVGPGRYDIRVKASTANGSYSITTFSRSFPSLYGELNIQQLNGGLPVVVSQIYPVNGIIDPIIPSLVIKAGSPGYAASPIVLWTENGPGSIVSTGALTASFTSSQNPYIDEATALANPGNRDSIITAVIEGLPELIKTVTVRAYPAESANTSAYSITGIQLVGPNNEVSPMSVLTNDTIAIGSIIQGTGSFPQSLNLVWSIVSGTGQILQELYAPNRPGEQIVFRPSTGTTQVKATAANGVFTTFSVTLQGVATLAISLNVASGQTFEAGSTFSVTATMSGTQLSNSAVLWTRPDGGYFNSTNYSTNGNVVTINVLDGDLAGELISFKAASVQDPTIFVIFDIFVISQITGIAIVTSKNTIGSSETVSAEAYFTGIGRITGPSTVGTQSFSWAVSGPATLVNTTGSFLTITSTATAGTIGISASIQGRSFVGNASISNTGIIASPTGLISVSAAYAGYNGIQTEYFPSDFATLIDSDNSTGLATGDGIDDPLRIQINLQGVKTIAKMKIGGGYLGDPWNNTVSNYLNLGLIEYSVENTSVWIKYATINGVTDNLGDLKIYLPEIDAQYWRITRSGYLAIASWTFEERPVPPSPTTLVVSGLTWSLIYRDSNYVKCTSLLRATYVVVTIGYGPGVSSTNASCSVPSAAVMRDALTALLGANAGFNSNQNCNTGNFSFDGSPGVERIYLKQ